MKLGSIIAAFVLTIFLISGNAVAAEKGKGGSAGTVVKVEEVYSKKEKLGGKKVTVKGKVVKFSPGIMGRNWIHLQDGSGKSGTNDLTITTDQNATIGDTVTITGTLAVDKDFGGGYRYAVIVEDATVSPAK